MKKIGEIGRQIIHIFSGLLMILLFITYGRYVFMLIILLALVLASIIVNLRLQNKKVIIFDWFEQKFERQDIRFPWWGPTFYLLGSLLIATFLSEPKAIASSIFILAVGDGFSTLIGLKGKHKLPYNDKKTIEGSMAFFLACLPLYLLIGNAIFPLAFIAAVVEAYPIKLEDNLTIPAACVLFFRLVGGT